MKKLKAIITVGISASGKTTWAENYCKKHKDFININRDDLRFSLTGSSGWQDYKFNKSVENLITAAHHDMIKEATCCEKNVILSNTNLNKKHRESLIDFLRLNKFEIEIKEFPISFKEACKRDAHRMNGVGYTIINRQWKQWLEYINYKTYEGSDGKPSAVIFDVDGTLADMTGVRTPFEWDKVGLDNPREVICDMLEGYHMLGYEIIILSGRDGCCESETRTWLDENIIYYTELHMRKPNDSRPDTEVKWDLFWDAVAPNYDVKAVIDDRPVMNRLWRDLGLTVIDVGDPYNEF